MSAMPADGDLATFPSVRIPSHGGGSPVEVTLIARLDRGGGDRLIAGASRLQSGHPRFVDALDEPSTRIGDVDFANGDASSLYTFVVGEQGHPFHRHAGHRVFTAVSGGAGTRLRFSTASAEQVARDSHSFVAGLHQVDVPPDCLFTVRFGGGTWHQFAPLKRGGNHPALFAISCHTNELGGELSPAQRERILVGEADIPVLTEALPAAMSDWLDGAPEATRIPTTVLSLDTPASTNDTSDAGRRRERSFLPSVLHSRGERNAGERQVRGPVPVDDGSLLQAELAGKPCHEDQFELVALSDDFADASASGVLAAMLAGFLESRPRGVSRLMAFRNTLVRPLGLRTSPLGCPVSSLLSRASDGVFAGRFPVLAQRIDAAGTRAEVILGADDRHLEFRSCVGVERLPDGRLRCTLATRVHMRNGFGRFYMAIVDPVHRRYIAPSLLRHAVAHAMYATGGTRLDH